MKTNEKSARAATDAALSPEDWSRIRAALRSQISLEVNRRRTLRLTFYDSSPEEARSTKREADLRQTLRKVSGKRKDPS